jgi:exodeoxyribonuclease V alpha subunit
MLDLQLAEALFRAVSSQAQLILIGDVDQLPSVGAGAVLADLIGSKVVPFARLDKVFRQSESSAIITNAHAINTGRSPVFTDDSDCRFISCDQPPQIRERILQLLSRDLPAMAFDPVRQVQILTPMNRGDLGTHALNLAIQDLLNPRQPGQSELLRGDLRLRAGDKVIQNVNNYELGVFNGDIGYIVHCMVDGGKTIVQFGDRQVTYSAEDAIELRLAYAITIHKSQGSEFPVVIIPSSMQHYVMLQRNLIYTGLTRAKKCAIFVGTARALQHAVMNQTSRLRQTRLKQRLQQCLDRSS